MLRHWLELNSVLAEVRVALQFLLFRQKMEKEILFLEYI